jgi:glycosyltransferase involved in cell wall biosynthesis
VHNHADLIFLPYNTDPLYVAEVFCMSNVYLHASNIDTFPSVVLEAMASGVPVVATAVGGIPEQVKGLKHENTDPAINTFEVGEATGILVANNDVPAMVRAVEVLMQQEIAERLGKNARQTAIEKYDFQLQVSRYQEWYQSSLER